MVSPGGRLEKPSLLYRRYHAGGGEVGFRERLLTRVRVHDEDAPVLRGPQDGLGYTSLSSTASGTCDRSSGCFSTIRDMSVRSFCLFEGRRFSSEKAQIFP